MTDHDRNPADDPELEAELRDALAAVANAVPLTDTTDGASNEPTGRGVPARPGTAAASTSGPGSDNDPTARRRWRRWQPVAAAALVVAVIGGGLIAWAIGRDATETVSTIGDDAGPDDADADGGPDGDTGEAGGFDGSYVLADGLVDGVAVPIVDGGEPTLVIDGDQWSGRAACNGYGGTAEVTTDGGGEVRIGELMWTAMACEPDLMASEQAFLDGLGRVERVEATTDGIVASGDGVELRFVTQLPPDEAPDGGPFTDVDWTLVTITDGEIASHAAEGFGSLRLGSDGSLTASGPCVALRGSYVFDGIELQSTSLRADYAAACGGEPSRDDRVIIDLMEGSRPTVTDGGSTLTLTKAESELEYVRADSAGEDDDSNDSGEPAEPDDAGAPTEPGGDTETDDPAVSEDDELQIVAVNRDLDLVAIPARGGDEVVIANLRRDVVPGIVGVDTIARNDERGVTYVGARLDDTGDADCAGQIIQVDDTGAGVFVADGIWPTLSNDGTQLGYAAIDEIDGTCMVTNFAHMGVGSAAGSSGQTLGEVGDIAAGGAPDRNLSWWQQGGEYRLMLARPGEIQLFLGFDRNLPDDDEDDAEWLSGGGLGSMDFDGDLAMAVRFGDRFVGMAGCCTDPITLADETADLATLPAPLRTLTAAADRLVMVDGDGTLWTFGPDDELAEIGTDYLAADAD